jgi:hypothetical protein
MVCASPAPGSRSSIRILSRIACGDDADPTLVGVVGRVWRVATMRSCENRRTHAISEEQPMDKKAKTPKKPKQTKTKDGAAKGK